MSTTGDGSGSRGRRARPPLPAALTERFEVLDEIGRGGMGVVFRARDRTSDMEIALKLTLSPIRSQRRLERFRREGNITASLRHPGIVGVHAAGEADDLPWLAYELIHDARTLEELLEAQPLERTLAQLRQAAAALGYAHSKGVFHRDVKPENILVDARGVARVADFGLASATTLERLTKTGAFIGTPSYMSPEQIAGDRQDVGPASDVWALGVILYRALTGSLPFAGETIPQLAGGICSVNPAPPRSIAPDVPPPLEAVCLQALAKDPGQRYPSGLEFQADLERYLAGESVEATRARVRRPMLWVVSLSLALLAGATALFLLPSHAAPDGQASASPIQIETPQDGYATQADSVELRGTARGALTRVQIRCGAWRRRVTVDAGIFSARVPLETGDNTIRIEAIGNEDTSSVSLQVKRWRVPDWYSALAESRRPALPLPLGMVFGQGAHEYLNQRDGSVLVWIPPDVYTVGSEDVAMTAVHPLPLQRIELQEGFFLGKLEVTWAQFREFCSDVGVIPPNSRIQGQDHSVLIDGRDEVTLTRAGPDHPVVRVSYPGAVAYCEWAGLRLPSETEWEIGARGHDGRRYPWGDNDPGPDDKLHNGERREDGYSLTAPVGSFPLGASPFGALDMAGNAWEWTADVFVPQAGDRTKPMRVVRGGAFNCSQFFCSSIYRDGATEAVEDVSRGLRVCRGLDPGRR